MDFTPVLRWYARRRQKFLTSLDAIAEQKRQLLRLLYRARETRFGREYDFRSIRTVEEYQRRVPLRGYEQFYEEYWGTVFPVIDDVTWPGRIPFFALTSGTTGHTKKYIPCSSEMNVSNVRASLDLLVHHILHSPKSRILGGKFLMLGGSTNLVRLSNGSLCGDLSGIAVRSAPWWAGYFRFLSRSVTSVDDWEERVSLTCALAGQERISMIAGIPSWLWILFERQASFKGFTEVKGRDLYPALELLVHGGISFTPYRRRFETFLEGLGSELREVYPASEGFIAVADGGSGDGLRLIVDNGLFFEFVPVSEFGLREPTRLWLQDVVCGVNYAVIVSTCAGLWSYKLGDTVRFVSLCPPRIVFTGRTGFMLSAFGEHLIVEEIEDGVVYAAGRMGCEVRDFAVGAVFTEKGTGYHVFVIEPTNLGRLESESLFESRFSELLDDYLCQRNEDYSTYRKGDFGMGAPEVRFVRGGTFMEWMRSRGKLGEQNKVPRVINDAGLFGDLLSFTAQGGENI